MSEGVGEARAEAEGELALARLALDAGELAHAAAHAGNAVAADPALRAAYQTLDELSAAAVDVQVLFPVEGTPYPGAVAARSYLMAREGKLDDAFGLLCAAAGTAPDKPWAAGWLAAPGASVPDLAGRMNPDIAARFMSRLALSLPNPVDADTAAVLRPFLDVARVVAARHPEPATVLPRLSSLARRMGMSGEAVAWCEQAEKADPSALAAIMLGYALRNAGRPQEAHQAWLRALRRDPGNVPLRVDIAEYMAARGRLDEGIRWLDEAIALAPGHQKAFPSACRMRYAKDGDITHLIRLTDWWREHPEHNYADKMLTKACSGKWWLSLVPSPGEAVAHGVPVPLDSTPWQRMRASNPVYWPRYTQAWACLGLLHHQTSEPWPGSARRRVLVDLVRGVEDWTADAALNALVTAAWTDPSIRTDVAGIVGARFADAMHAFRQREVTIAISLAHLVLITPGMPSEAASRARTVIKRASAAETQAAADTKPHRRPFRRRNT